MSKCERCGRNVMFIIKRGYYDNRGRWVMKYICNNCRRALDAHYEARGAYNPDGTVSSGYRIPKHVTDRSMRRKKNPSGRR